MKERIIKLKTEKYWKLNFTDGILILMINYELVCILNPQLDDKKKLVKEIEAWMENIGAKIKKKEEWGNKELAYQIKKFSNGFYIFWRIEAEPAKIGALLSKIKLEDRIIRYLLVRKD